MITARSLGHDIYSLDGKNWFYEDGAHFDDSRPCVKCGCSTTPEGHDTCLANLPGVKFACCGHGIREDSYIVFENGICIRGFTIDKE